MEYLVSLMHLRYFFSILLSTVQMVTAKKKKNCQVIINCIQESNLKSSYDLLYCLMYIGFYPSEKNSCA